jgi:hypothetical protein
MPSMLIPRIGGEARIFSSILRVVRLVDRWIPLMIPTSSVVSFSKLVEDKRPDQQASRMMFKKPAEITVVPMHVISFTEFGRATIQRRMESKLGLISRHVIGKRR